ncbi:hypothetical protein CFAM422_002325 [Trichoderma lentiforme]|uniref:Uncharacterized protein n=1 Tax=Trichoderma lentiforme TaxID=1567552 RepID=A0A9P5CHY3_9HYPO|nr:hypothetical protein CFAM422_002325 [Trichoderma lentiforme]
MSLQPPASHHHAACLPRTTTSPSKPISVFLLRFSGRPNLVYFVQAPSRLALPGKTQKGPSPIPVSDPVGCTSVSWCADHSDPGTPVIKACRCLAPVVAVARGTRPGSRYLSRDRTNFFLFFCPHAAATEPTLAVWPSLTRSAAHRPIQHGCYLGAFANHVRATVQTPARPARPCETLTMRLRGNSFKFECDGEATGAKRKLSSLQDNRKWENGLDDAYGPAGARPQTQKRLAVGGRRAFLPSSFSSSIRTSSARPAPYSMDTVAGLLACMPDQGGPFLFPASTAAYRPICLPD